MHPKLGGKRVGRVQSEFKICSENEFRVSFKKNSKNKVQNKFKKISSKNKFKK